MDLVKENQNLKMQIKKGTKDEDDETEVVDVSEDSIEKIANRVAEKMKEDNSTEQKLNNKIKEDSNMFESFFNGILKNEREEK